MIIEFFLYVIFIIVGTIFVFLVIEKMLDGSTMTSREKLQLFYKNKKNLDTEKKKLYFHYYKYLTGSFFLVISIYFFIHSYLFLGSPPNTRSLIIFIIIFLFGLSEIINEYFYEESKINYKYTEKYGWRTIFKLGLYKEIMKNSPIALVRDGILFLIVGLFALILVVGFIFILF